MIEEGHDIEVIVDRGYAKLVVRRTLLNTSDTYDQAVIFIHPPSEAVAVGLRTQGGPPGKPRWFNGDLYEAEEAADKYQQLTGRGGYTPKDPALLSWRTLGELALQVFPCEPGKAKKVEYTLMMPTTYQSGAHVFWLPELGTEALLATARFRPARRGDRIEVNGEPVDPDRLVALDREHEVRFYPGRAATIDGALAAVGVSPDKGLHHWRFELAAPISTVPKLAFIVVVLDVSRSMGSERITAAKAAARAYLANFVDAKVEVVTFARRAQRLLGNLGTIEQTDRRIAAPMPVGGNGSAVELGLALADEVLAAAPKGVARRVVLLTDSLARSSLAVADLEEAVSRSRALLHVGSIDVGYDSLRRDDHHPWATVARANGGLAWEARAASEARSEKPSEESVSVYEEWARPKRLDHVLTRAPGFSSKELDVPYVSPAPPRASVGPRSCSGRRRSRISTRTR